MKKSFLIIALVFVMVFGFASAAFADHSPVYYFDFKQGATVVANTSFQAVFSSAFNVSFAIDNGSFALGTATPHSGYSQSTAKCGVCHAVHRAPILGTSSFNTADIAGGTAVSSSRYSSKAFVAEATTQMLLKSSTARACLYCHVSSASGGTHMYAGDMTLDIVGDSAFGWGQFYAHTAGCISCHAVHGASTFKSADKTVDALILKYQGVKALGTVALKVQPEVYGGSPALYANLADMKAGVLTAAAVGVTPLQAAATAQCTICHAQYAVGEEIINANYLNAELFQPGSWSSANGVTTKIFVGTTAVPVSVLPGTPGLTYTDVPMTGAAGSLIMAYKNHPLKAGGQDFKGSGASNSFTTGAIHVSETGSSVCQSCHNAPDKVFGGYSLSSYPHYTPGYYKFMAAQDQSLFDTPSTLADFAGGRAAFYNSGFGSSRAGKPAVMNDGYCTKCHSTIGTDY